MQIKSNWNFPRLKKTTEDEKISNCFEHDKSLKVAQKVKHNKHYSFSFHTIVWDLIYIS